jgi:hypothetical protein
MTFVMMGVLMLPLCLLYVVTGVSIEQLFKQDVDVGSTLVEGVEELEDALNKDAKQQKY